MSSHKATVRASGHLIDTGLMSRYLETVIEAGGTYEIVRFDPGRTVQDFSEVELALEHTNHVGMERMLANLSALGAEVLDGQDVRLQQAPQDGVAPEGFYSTTNHRTLCRVNGVWIEARKQRMDAVLVVDQDGVTCTKLRDLRAGQDVVCGPHGVSVKPAFKARESSDFVFMGDSVSSERVVSVRVRQVAGWMREVRTGGKGIVLVAGPVVVHTGAAEHLERLLEKGWFSALLSGNALAVHDCERVLYGTSLGVAQETGIPVAEGHMNHMRAINAIRAAGSLHAAVEQGLLTRGVFHACIHAQVPFVLAGSIRDDGPLPDTEMDLVAAQNAYAEHLEGAGLVLILSTMLHGIGVGNMLPSHVRTVCVDIHQAVVTKLNDRGSSQAIGVVTDVGTFLHHLVQELERDVSSS